MLDPLVPNSVTAKRKKRHQPSSQSQLTVLKVTRDQNALPNSEKMKPRRQMPNSEDQQTALMETRDQNAPLNSESQQTARKTTPERNAKIEISSFVHSANEN